LKEFNERCDDVLAEAMRTGFFVVKEGLYDDQAVNLDFLKNRKDYISLQGYCDRRVLQFLEVNVALRDNLKILSHSHDYCFTFVEMREGISASIYAHILPVVCAYRIYSIFYNDYGMFKDMFDKYSTAFKDILHTVKREHYNHVLFGPISLIKCERLEWDDLVEKRDQCVHCEHAAKESDPLVDPTMEIDVISNLSIPYVVEDYEHNGQYKLMLGESQFISDAMRKFIIDGVVVLGSAPGMHYANLAEVYKNLTFFSFDPQPFLGGDNVHHIPWHPYCTFEEVYNVLRRKTFKVMPSVLVISDIWVGNFVETQALVEEYVSRLNNYVKVIAVSEKQFVDFAFPSTPQRALGKRYGQVYLGGKSGEIRSVTYGNNLNVSLVDSGVLEKKINYFRSVIKKYSRINIAGQDQCFTCGMENIIIASACAAVGRDVHSVFMSVKNKESTHPALGLLKSVKNLDGLKRKSALDKVNTYVYTAKVVKGNYYMPGGKIVRRGDIKIIKWKYNYTFHDYGMEYAFTIKDYGTVYVSKGFFLSSDVMFYPESDILREFSTTSDPAIIFLDTGEMLFLPPLKKLAEGILAPKYQVRKYLTSDPSEYACPYGCGGGLVPASCYLHVYGDIDLKCGHNLKKDVEISLSQIHQIT
jgi:hypothetical protein